MTSQTQKIYDVAKDSLETHCTLNNNIPAEVGCAEAVSFILKKAGVVGVPETGIPGTASLYEWLASNPSFMRIYAPLPGAIVVSATGTGNGTISGHTGVFGILGKMYKDDYGIVSNDSNTGLLLELWNWKNWQKYYQQQGGLTTGIFLAK